MKDVVALWLRRAENDLRVAALSLEEGINEACVFHCQQALEKLLKAILMERSPTDRTRRTHDLVWLAREVLPEIEIQRLEFLRELAEDYVTSRYGDEELGTDVDLLDYLRKSQEMFAWLRPLLS